MCPIVARGIPTYGQAESAAVATGGAATSGKHGTKIERKAEDAKGKKDHAKRDRRHDKGHHKGRRT
jgi:hypothetical protein